MLHPTLIAGVPAATTPTLTAVSPTRRSLCERDEFGTLDGASGLLRDPLDLRGLDAREDLGHALCPWVAREDLL